MINPDAPLRICLAGSGGGHLRQLLDLEPVWSRFDHFFVTEDSAIGRDLAESHRVYFVPHYAVGQARLGRPDKLLRGGVSNWAQSVAIVRRERPDIVITTGAAAVFGVAAVAKLVGAKLILIESFARFDGPSKFARIVRRLANETIVQSLPLKERWPEAHLFDPLRGLDEPRGAKEPLLLATVGATLPFDRLSAAIIDLKRRGAIDEQVVLQTGLDSQCAAKPDVPGLRQVATIEFAEMKTLLNRADIVVCHGGTGSLVTALREGCRVIAMPRSFARGEHYDDHQFEITTAFAQRALIEVARTVEELPEAIARAKAKEPVRATTDHTALIAWLNSYLRRVKV
jgi:UDP-N-acetylglucosamine--N-acetylmuramyl-(pentapeptide) pyrophosphoryl-undecaprenol N-acetylglucosamine transferase